MKSTTRVSHHAVLSAILVIVAVSLSWPRHVHAQSQVADPDFSYQMFYPKYAKGRQPTAYDVGEFDNVNLYNGGLSLTVPLGPPLVAGADLSWQAALHYSSKFWSWDLRRNGDECQGKGFVVGDAHAGLGWTFKLPHIFLRQQWDAAIGTSRYYLDSVITSDGARHQLRHCLEGWDCRDGSPAEVQVGERFREYWYSADGSGWRIYRDHGPHQGFPGLMSTNQLIGEHRGLRYHFTLRRIFEYGQTGDEIVTDTDFLSQARGWYCTLIESIRWPGPWIEIDYDTAPEGSPIPRSIVAHDANGEVASEIEVTVNPIFLTVSNVIFKDGEGVEQLRYELSYQRNQYLRIKASKILSEYQLCSSHPDYRLFTNPLSYLTGIRLHTASGISLDWDFGTFQEEPDPPGAPDGELDVEPKGRIRRLTLPTGAVAEYEYEEWTFFYQALGVQAPDTPGPILHDTDFCGLGNFTTNIGSDPPGDLLTYSTLQPGWAVVDRKVVDVDSRLLEWTEYKRDGFAGILTNLYEPPFDFANTNLRARDGERSLLPDPVADPDYRRHFYSGIALTVVRRHLAVDHQPGSAADDLEDLRDSGYTIDLPSARFDDTANIFSTGRFFYDRDGDGRIAITNQGDVWGTLPLEGRPLEIRSYRGAHHLDGEDFWYCTTDTNPRLERRTLFTYTLDRENDTPSLDEHLTPVGSALLGGYEQYSGARQENVQNRRQTTQYLRASLLEDAQDDFADPLYSGTESWFERDVECQPGECTFDWRAAYGFTRSIAEPRLPTNRVLSISTSDFTESAPNPWNLDLLAATTFEKSFTDEIWLPNLIHEKVATLTSPSSFERTTTAFRANGAVKTVRRHLSLSTNESDDIATIYTYWLNPAEGTVFGYGKPKTVSMKRSGTVDSLTATRYVVSPGGAYGGPYQRESWVLCPPGADPDEKCSGWGSAPTAFGGTGESQSRAAFDPFWRSATALSDGNGDGLVAIERDELGRLIYLEPSDSSKSPTWLLYDPDLRWSEVQIEDPVSQRVRVQHSDFDGLGRLRHHDIRRGGSFKPTTNPVYGHQTLFYDGAGTAGAESHMLTTRALQPPNSFSSDSDWEMVAAVDPFGRRDLAA